MHVTAHGYTRGKIIALPAVPISLDRTCLHYVMHQSFVTMAPPRPWGGRGIAEEMYCVFTFQLSLQCRENARDLFYIGKNGNVNITDCGEKGPWFQQLAATAVLDIKQKFAERKVGCRDGVSNYYTCFLCIFVVYTNCCRDQCHAKRKDADEPAHLSSLIAIFR